MKMKIRTNAHAFSAYEYPRCAAKSSETHPELIITPNAIAIVYAISCKDKDSDKRLELYQFSLPRPNNIDVVVGREFLYRVFGIIIYIRKVPSSG